MMQYILHGTRVAKTYQTVQSLPHISDLIQNTFQGRSDKLKKTDFSVYEATPVVVRSIFL